MKKHQFTILVLAVVFSATAMIGKAQNCVGTAGCLDTTFDADGKQFLLQNGSSHRDVVVQSDGKIVSLVNNQNGNTLIRLNADGSPDTTFDTDGIVQTDWHYNSNLPRGYPVALVVQNVGGEERLVVAGSWTVSAGKNTSVTMLRVDRYLSNGAIDTSFGTNGSVIINKPSAEAVAIQPTDNKIIMVGPGQAVVRLNENGTIDTGFGQNGDGATGAGQAGYAIKGLADGSIIIGGTYSSNGGNVAVMCVSKLNANGSIATSFGSGGRAIADFYGRGSLGRAFSVEVDPYGNIVAGGFARGKNDTYNKFAAARFTAGGQLDPTFNGTGMVTYSFTNLGQTGNSILAQADGKLILTGFTQLSTADTSDYALVRLNFDGTVDTAFGNTGRVTTNFSGSDYSQSSRLWLDPLCACEKIVMAGASQTGVSFARYTTQ
jgi:uncharacterized delta-60 repeat protein